VKPLIARTTIGVSGGLTGCQSPVPCRTPPDFPAQFPQATARLAAGPATTDYPLSELVARGGPAAGQVGKESPPGALAAGARVFARAAVARPLACALAGISRRMGVLGPVVLTVGLHESAELSGMAVQGGCLATRVSLCGGPGCTGCRYRARRR
jgi:hypothetical protein